jgi:lipopolysaccharide transport system ATP-binding protein
MSSDEIAIRISGLSKCYQIYAKPSDRLKQFLLPRLKRLLGKSGHTYFREFWALKDVSFEVKRGETVGIIGRNGSGKSTLLQIICGTLTPSAGEVQVNGRVAALLELGAGFNPEFTGRENVYLNAAVLGLKKEEIDARFDKIEAFADIGEFIDQPVKTYSSGMYVKLAFAVIAHVDADILVVDEALAVGDAFFTQKCMRFLRSFMKTGTVLFVSHDTGSIRSLCNKAIWLEKGVVFENGSPKEVSEHYLEAFYEAQQGKSTTTRLKNGQSAAVNSQVDQRQALINGSNLRNDIEVFHFNADAPSFGQGGAEITAVKFLDANGNPLAWIVGGEEVCLRVEVIAHTLLQSPIIGFFVKDKLGQNLFGDNTWLSYMDTPIVSEAGQLLVAEFVFFMPRLMAGHYAITVAIADGTQFEHVQHHWVHDAISFRSETSSLVSGILGIPMTKIKLKVEE